MKTMHVTITMYHCITDKKYSTRMQSNNQFLMKTDAMIYTYDHDMIWFMIHDMFQYVKTTDYRSSNL